MVGPGHRTCARRSSSISSTRSPRYGRIWRLRYDGRPAVPATDTNIGQPAIPAIAPDFTRAADVQRDAGAARRASHAPNGWWRDTAQRLLVLKQDKSVVPALQQMARSSDNLRRAVPRDVDARGPRRARRALVREVMKDANPRMRIQAIRASETLYKAGDKTFADDYRALTKDADPNVVIQAMLTMNLFKLPDAARHGQGGAGGEHRRSGVDDDRRPPARAAAGGLRRRRRPRRRAHARAAEADAAGQRRVRRRLLLVPRRRTAAAQPLAGAARRAR